MLHITVALAAFIALSIFIKIDEIKIDRLRKEYDETDWNVYYAHI